MEAGWCKSVESYVKHRNITSLILMKCSLTRNFRAIVTILSEKVLHGWYVGKIPATWGRMKKQPLKSQGSLGLKHPFPHVLQGEGKSCRREDDVTTAEGNGADNEGSHRAGSGISCMTAKQQRQPVS